MLSVPSQNDNFPTGRVYLKKQTRVTANQHIFKSYSRNMLQKDILIFQTTTF